MDFDCPGPATPLKRNFHSMALRGSVVFAPRLALPVSSRQVKRFRAEIGTQNDYQDDPVDCDDNAFEVANSGAFSFVQSAPLRVLTLPPSLHKTDGPSPEREYNTLPELRVIRSTGKFSSAAFPGTTIEVAGNSETQGNSFYNNCDSQYNLAHSNYTQSIHSTQSDFTSETINPCLGLAMGPHQPPFPAIPLAPRPVDTSFFGLDPFAEYMEERMVRFRPSSSQNNVESSLNFTHPYQVTDEKPMPLLWKNWFQGVLPAREVLPVEEALPVPNVLAALVPGVEAPPAHSSCSFLPRNVNVEPQPNLMAFTPQGFPLENKLPGGELLNSLDPDVQAILLGPCFCGLWG